MFKNKLILELNGNETKTKATKNKKIPYMTKMGEKTRKNLKLNKF